MSQPGPWGLRATALRRCALALAVLHDLDVTVEQPSGDGLPGLQVSGLPPMTVPGGLLAAVLGDAEPDARESVDRLADWLRIRRLVVSLPQPLLLESLRAVGLPVGHVRHPGSGWVREPVPGGALELGFGLMSGPPDGAPAPLPLPSTALDGVVPDAVARAAWTSARGRLDELGRLAADRQRRRRAPLRPVAEADVVTLLGSEALRRQLAGDPHAGGAGGLVGLIVPVRNRGWVASAAIDPAFGPAAASATDPTERGFLRPLLVTRDEVVQVPPRENPLRYLQPRRPTG